METPPYYDSGASLTNRLSIRAHMPFIELISFITVQNVGEDESLVAQYDSSLLRIVNCEGCLDFVYGRQIENSGRMYFITTWDNYDLYDKATHSTAYASFMAYLIHHATSEPSMQHFDIDGDPHEALAAPVTEVVVLKSKAADWSWDQELHAGIKGANKGLPLVAGSYPPLRWGESKEGFDSGCYCMLVGWESVQSHYRAAKEKPLRSHVRKIRQTTSLIDARHVIFRSLRSRTDESRASAQKVKGLRIHSFL